MTTQNNTPDFRYIVSNLVNPLVLVMSPAAIKKLGYTESRLGKNPDIPDVVSSADSRTVVSAKVPGEAVHDQSDKTSTSGISCEFSDTRSLTSHFHLWLEMAQTVNH